jgi:DNA-binding transcriptional ArsR family regulator
MNKTIMIYSLLADSIRRGEHPTHGEIAERLDVDIRTVSAGLKALREAGYITSVRKISNRRRCEYKLTDKRPPWFDRLCGWMYRFTATEANRRFWEATVSSRIFYKARELRGRHVRDPELIRLRDELFADHPDLCDVSAVWPVDKALIIERRLNELLDWGKAKNDQVPALATIPDPESDDGA